MKIAYSLECRIVKSRIKLSALKKNSAIGSECIILIFPKSRNHETLSQIRDLLHTFYLVILPLYNS